PFLRCNSDEISAVVEFRLGFVALLPKDPAQPLPWQERAFAQAWDVLHIAKISRPQSARSSRTPHSRFREMGHVQAPGNSDRGLRKSGGVHPQLQARHRRIEPPGYTWLPGVGTRTLAAQSVS